MKNTTILMSLSATCGRSGSIAGRTTDLNMILQKWELHYLMYLRRKLLKLRARIGIWKVRRIINSLVANNGSSFICTLFISVFYYLRLAAL